MVQIKGKLINISKSNHIITAYIETEYDYYNHPLKKYKCTDCCIRVTSNKNLVNDFIDEFVGELALFNLRAVSNKMGGFWFIIDKIKTYDFT